MLNRWPLSIDWKSVYNVKFENFNLFALDNRLKSVYNGKIWKFLISFALDNRLKSVYNARITQKVL